MNVGLAKFIILTNGDSEMAKEKDDHVVIALVKDQDSAKAAEKSLKDWDKGDKDLKLGNIGWIYKKGDKVKTHMGREAGKGAATGGAIGIIAGVLSGGMTVVAGAVGAGVIGGITGSFFKKSANLTKDEIQKIGKSLDGGQVAMVVTCTEDDVQATSAELTKLGATVTSYAVKGGALTDAAKAMDAAGVTPPTDDDDSSDDDAPAADDAPAS
jgi:hypothetical protein